jgi:hypothetical protein
LLRVRLGNRIGIDRRARTFVPDLASYLEAKATEEPGDPESGELAA